jgi:hypothetical protein
MKQGPCGLLHIHRHARWGIGGNAQLCVELFAALPQAGDFALARVKDRFKGGGMTGRGRNPFALRRAAFHGVDAAQSVVQRQRVISAYYRNGFNRVP